VDPVLNQLNSVRKLTPYFFKIHFNIIFPLSLDLQYGFVPFKFSDYNFVCISDLYHACYMPSCLIFLNVITLIISGEKYNYKAHFPVFSIGRVWAGFN
jgi:hypothetical protein